MAKDTQPVFVIGTGRSGTRTLYRMLAGADDLEIHHEYVCTHVQPLAARYFMGLISKKEVKKELGKLHGSAIGHSPKKTWIDCSNKLSWLIEPLLEMFPNAKFLLVTRDGRKVTSSFFYKLREEMYDDESVRVMQTWLKNTKKSPMPPPEKKYWWNIPRKGQAFHQEFEAFDRLERTAYHWAECHRFILEKFEKINPSQVKKVRLEDMVADGNILKETLEFLGVDDDPFHFEYIQSPKNVFFPLDFQLTQSQLEKFNRIAGPMMKTLGYADKDSYVVRY